MLDLTIRPEAERDIKDIWRYTRKTWSRQQADHYVGIIRASLSELAHWPDRGRPCNEISPGLFRLAIERHVAFYRQSDRELLIIRILHASMDFLTHLANDDT